MKKAGLVNRISWMGVRWRMATALAVAVGVFLALLPVRSEIIRGLSAWDSFILSSLALCWITIVGTQARDLREQARRQDFGAKMIFVFTAIAACVSIAAVIYVMHTAGHSHRFGAYVPLSYLAVLAGWGLLHTIFALHYAHTFYGDHRTRGAQYHAGGLEFPGEEAPDYRDFAYYSFVIGMTFQVSDVDITSRPMRRLTLVHALLSFAFNTLIIALAINTISSLLA